MVDPLYLTGAGSYFSLTNCFTNYYGGMIIKVKKISLNSISGALKMFVTVIQRQKHPFLK